MKNRLVVASCVLLSLSLPACRNAFADAAEQQASINATIERAKVQAAANAQHGPAPYPGGPLTVQTMQTVPFGEGPKVAPGPGWYCFEFTKKQDGKVEKESLCERNLPACRDAAYDQSRRSDRNARSPITYEVGSCVRQETAHCMYVWRDGTQTGGHRCHLRAEDCRPFLVAQPGVATKQTECGAVE